MEIEQSKVTKLKLTKLEGLDPVTVFLEDFERGKGKITIECYGESWSAYWGAMGGTISEFFTSCDEHYIAKNLSGISSDITDENTVEEIIKLNVIKCRRNKAISSFEARYLFDDAGLEMLKEGRHKMVDADLFELLFECDGIWHVDLPTMTNPKYDYLCRIINAVKDALKQLQQPLAV